MKKLFVYVYDTIAGVSGAACSYIDQVYFFNIGVILYLHQSTVNDIGRDGSGESCRRPSRSVNKNKGTCFAWLKSPYWTLF